MIRTIIFAATLLFGLGPAWAADPSGRAIMDEVSRRHDADIDAQTQRMLLVEGNGKETERVLRRYARKGADGLSRYLLVFDEPAGVRGVALLTWEKPGDDDQWTFLPALGNQLKRVAGGGRRSNFMGTDFAFEDMVTEERDQFSYDRLADETVGGHRMFVIDATPARDDDTTSYDRRRLYVRQDNYMVAKVEYFAKGSGRQAKTFIVDEMTPAKGLRWTAVRTTMATLKDGHKTVTTMLSRSESSADVPEDVFSHLYIQSKRHIR